MRVLHVYKSYYPETVGGIEQVIAQLGAGLIAMGDESRIFTLSPTADPRVLKRPEGDVHRSRTTVDFASTPLSIRAFREFRRQLEWADVVHYQFPWPFADVLHMTSNCGKPSVVSYQSDVVRQKVLLRAYTPLMRHFLRSVSAVVATSPQYVASSPVLARLGSRVRVIPNGIDEASYPQPGTERLSHWRQEVGEGFFLFVGVLRYYKGLETLLRAAKSFRGQIVIAGTGPESEALMKHAVREGLSNVRFLGSVTEEDKMCLLHLARGFVFPSHLRSEAFGMSLVEAAMCGKPMVSCEIGTGTSFINEDGVTGEAIAPEDPDALRAAMHRLMDDPARAQAMGSAARQRFEALFTAQRMAASYHALYRELAAAGASAAR